MGRKPRPIHGKKYGFPGTCIAVLSHDNPPVIDGLCLARAMTTFNGIQRTPEDAKRKTRRRTDATATTATG